MSRMCEGFHEIGLNLVAIQQPTFCTEKTLILHRFVFSHFQENLSTCELVSSKEPKTIERDCNRFDFLPWRKSPRFTPPLRFLPFQTRQEALGAIRDPPDAPQHPLTAPAAPGAAAPGATGREYSTGVSARSQNKVPHATQARMRPSSSASLFNLRPLQAKFRHTTRIQSANRVLSHSTPRTPQP